VIAPIKTIGTEAGTSLRVSFWHSTVEDSPQASDPSFISVSLRTSGAGAWRNSEPSGPVSMLPFEGAHWHFEQPVSFVQLHLPFALPSMVCDALFGREFASRSQDAGGRQGRAAQRRAAVHQGQDPGG
jgi:hypothetical protein